MKLKKGEITMKLKLVRRIIMKKIYGVVTLAAVLIGATLLLERTVRVAAAASPTGIKNVVLVHGAFADGSGWEAVAKILEKDGYRVSVAQPPETSYADDQKYTKAAIDAMGGPVVLVGHSYGGSIITEAGNDTNVAALVYIAAFALDDGESCASIEQALPRSEEHTSELQSRLHLVCRLLLEKKKKQKCLAIVLKKKKTKKNI